MKLEALPLRVIETRDDGSGRVRMPIGCIATIDTTRTAGGGSGEITLGAGEWESVVRNFTKRRRPVPVYFGHIPDEYRQRTPASGFVESVSFDGEYLWALVDLNAAAFNSVVVERGFRSASVEIVRDATTPTESLPGWSLVGLALTNTPALPVEYAVAASTIAGLATSARLRLTVAFTPPQKEQEMANQETLQADAIRLEGALLDSTKAQDALRAQLETANREKMSLAQQINATRTDMAKLELRASLAEGRNSELEKELDKSKADVLRLTESTRVLTESQNSERIKRIINTAVARGVNPSMFEGWKDEPCKWLSSRFVSVDAFETFCGALAGKKSASFSTAAPPIADAGEHVLSPELKAILARNKIDPRYMAVRTAADLALIKKEG